VYTLTCISPTPARNKARNHLSRCPRPPSSANTNLILGIDPHGQ
jgi:hypothetical protein